MKIIVECNTIEQYKEIYLEYHLDQSWNIALNHLGLVNDHIKDKGRVYFNTHTRSTYDFNTVLQVLSEIDDCVVVTYKKYKLGLVIKDIELEIGL